MVNADVNRELLKDAVYYQKEDMAAIARCRAGQEGGDVYSFLVTKENLSAFQMTEGEVLERAYRNTARQEFSLMSMEDIMISTLETQKQLKIEVRDIKDDVHQLKEEQPIAPYPLLKMDTARKRKVIEVLGGKKSNAYRTISKRVFSEAGRDFKEFFGIPRYDMLPKKHAEQGLDYWNDWEPCTNTKMEIKEFNSQIALEV